MRIEFREKAGRLYHGLFLGLGIGSIAMAGSSKPVVITALGDSLTAGTPFFQSPLEKPPQGEGDVEAPYPSWLSRRHPDWRVHNFGIAGQTTDQLLVRTDDALATSPRYLIVLGGTNDILQELPLAGISRNLHLMYRRAKSRYVIPVAATVPPLGSGATPRQRQAIEKLNRWIRQNAEKERIPIVDLFEVLSDATRPGTLPDTPDGYHPDLGGYRKMGLAIADAIEDMESHRPGR